MKRYASIFLTCALLATVATAADIFRNAIDDGLHETAIRQAEKVLQGKPTPEEAQRALKALMEAHVSQGKPAEALKALERFPAVAGTMADDAEFLFWKAWAEKDAGNLEAAWQTLAPATQGKSGWWATTCAQQRARLAMELGREEEGLRFYEERIKTAEEKGKMPWLLAYAAALRQVGRVEKFAEVMAELAEWEPLMDDVRILEYTMLHDDAGKAIELLQPILTETTPSDSHPAAFLRIPALLFAARVAKTNGVEYARQALALAEKEGVRLQRGEALRTLGNLLLATPETIDEGAEVTRRFVREFRDAPETPRVKMELANALLAAGRADAAFAEYQAFLEAFGETTSRNVAYAGQGRARFEQGRFAEAARLFQRAADGAEETPALRTEWLSRAADAIFSDGQYAEAARMYRQVYTLFPESELAGEMLLRAADALARSGDMKAALETSERAAEVAPSLAAEARVRQSELLARQGEVASAVALADTIIATEQDAALRGRAYLAKGQAYYTAFEFAKALQAFESAAKIEAAADEAAWLSVLALYGMGRDEAAHDAAEAYRNRGEGRFLQDARLWLIKYAFNTKQFETVSALADEYVEAAPRDRWADAVLLWSARAATQAADFLRAVDDIGRLRRMFPTSEHLPEGVYVQGGALMELGRFQEALMVFDDLITRHPESAWTTRAWLRKGDALYQLGVEQDANFSASIAAYEEALLRYDITPALRFEAAYKIGRGFERTNRMNDAFDQYYTAVVAPFLEQFQKESATVSGAGEWFSRAVFRATEILDLKNDPDAAVRLLERVVRLRAPGAGEAQERIKRLRNRGG